MSKTFLSRTVLGLCAGLTLTLSAVAHAAYATDNARVLRVKTFNGGTIHVTFDKGVCGSQTWARISGTDVGSAAMLSTALAARLSGSLVSLEVTDVGGAGSNCRLDFIQIRE